MRVCRKLGILQTKDKDANGIAECCSSNYPSIGFATQQPIQLGMTLHQHPEYAELALTAHTIFQR
jgi:hypothetical protein